jgi:beta-galactosidase GanA
MQGGGFQIYHQPTRSGYLVEPIIAQEEAVAKFCRARQDVSQKSTTVPQVALLLSGETTWQKAETVYSPSADVLTDVEGALHVLLNLHYSVDVLAEHQLEPRLADYPLVVVPDAFKLTPEFRRALTAYVESGGKLLLLGEKCARLFEPILGVEFVGAPESREGELASLSGMTNAAGIWQKVKLTTALAAGFIHPTRDIRKGAEVAATVNAHGQGKVAAVYGPVASIYFRSHHPWLREFLTRSSALSFRRSVSKAH